jgi:hypothetical protein
VGQEGGWQAAGDGMYQRTSNGAAVLASPPPCASCQLHPAHSPGPQPRPTAQAHSPGPQPRPTAQAHSHSLPPDVLHEAVHVAAAAAAWLLALLLLKLPLLPLLPLPLCLCLCLCWGLGVVSPRAV